MNRVYLSLGSNIGDRENYLKQAISIVEANPLIYDVKSSSFYETEPQGYKDQDYFINCALQCNTTLTPTKLLDFTQSIEKKLKRVKLFRWGPRTIDVDILLYGKEKIDTRSLTIPHPRMYERAFVLVPLSELNSDFKDSLENLDYQDVKLMN